MIDFRQLNAQDYNDILDISKDIWDGTDYLPKVFYKWVEDSGIFLGAVDSDKNKVVGVGKLTFLPDDSGWLEGLRVHISYRSQGLGRKITETLLKIAKEELKSGRINAIAFATHVTSKDSISIMESNNFRVAEAQLLAIKEKSALPSRLTIDDFRVEPWDISYEELRNHLFVKRREGLIPLAFVFQRLTHELYESIREENGFIKINGHPGVFKYKGEPNFLAFEDNIDSIDTFMNYYLLKYQDEVSEGIYTPVLPEDETLIDRLKAAGYVSWNGWKPDYLYYVYR